MGQERSFPLCFQPGFHLEVDLALAEEAVRASVQERGRAARFYPLWERIYLIADEEEREEAFAQLHREWFVKLALQHPLVQVLADYPQVVQQSAGCLVRRAVFQKQEHADFLGSSPRWILVALRPESLLQPRILRPFLRHEFMHLADMLDPTFDYRPTLPGDGGPRLEHLLRERYRVLWDTWIDGRLFQRGWVDSQVRRQRLQEFRNTFPMLGRACDSFFYDWFRPVRRTHQQLVHFACRPGKDGGDNEVRGRCPLCQFPAPSLCPGSSLSGQTVNTIRHEFPHWHPDQGLCRQCADLYEARSLSREALQQLPGSHTPPARPPQRGNVDSCRGDSVHPRSKEPADKRSLLPCRR